MNPLDWGWVQKGDHLFPISMSKPAAPDGLLKVIRCSCKTDSRARCPVLQVQFEVYIHVQKL